MNFRHGPLYPTRRSPVFGDNIVSTSHPLAAQAGLTVLREGGGTRWTPPSRRRRS